MTNNTDVRGATVFAPNVIGAGDRPSALYAALVHHLPGRLRLRSAVLKDDPRASEEACHDLARIDGVTSARANPATGSVLLEYDPDVISPSKVGDVLGAHGYVIGVPAAETEVGAGWADKLATAVKDWVINALVEHLALAVISALA